MKGDDMADKKVERSGRERPLTPVQKLKSALSDPGTMNMADPAHDKGKAALVDKFREREERWRREQAFRDRESAQSLEHGPERGSEDAAEADVVAESEGHGKGGGS
jgi:hypothetical protein